MLPFTACVSQCFSIEFYILMNLANWVANNIIKQKSKISVGGTISLWFYRDHFYSENQYIVEWI